MGDYLKLFKTHSEYEAYSGGGEMLKPNVSYCRQENEVHYNPIPDYSKEYLTFVAKEAGTISFNILSPMGTDKIESISYSTDNGKTWTTTPNQDNKSQNIVIGVNVNTGDTILWKGTATQTGFYYQGEPIGSFFSSTANFDVQGNVMSLLYGDDFKEKVDLTGKNYAFYWLFYNNTKVVSVENLSLPATTLANYCYGAMFFGCTSLTTAPELPATTLVDSCYSGMFMGCTSLTTAPELPATTLAQDCYYSMFSRCTSLTTAPELPATTLVSRCYNNMFNGCTALTTAPELPVTTLADGCYQNMFQDCTSLTTAPVLPATTLAQSCYGAMFIGCTSLTTAPVLPATTLASSCYYSMFSRCTSLTTAPVLPATTLAQGCYYNMFNGCTKLNYIKAMFTTTPSTTYTSDWVKGVYVSGTFVKNSAATWNVTGNSGIPSGWTVTSASA